MGVDTPIPQKMRNAAAPDGAPPRRIKTVEIIICRFSWRGCEPDQFMPVSTEHNFFNTILLNFSRVFPGSRLVPIISCALQSAPLNVGRAGPGSGPGPRDSSADCRDDYGDGNVKQVKSEKHESHLLICAYERRAALRVCAPQWRY